MPRLALALYALYLALALGWRSWHQLRTTGSSGFVGISRASGLEALAGLLLIASLAFGLAAPLVAWRGERLAIGPVQAGAGIACWAAGLALTLWAQLHMGASWRIGVDPRERTALVTDGPFAFARNPIFTGMASVALGLALLVPNTWSLLALAALLAGLALQVRLVEEPYLLRTHGEAYRVWAARTGRFLPGVGRLR